MMKAVSDYEAVEDTLGNTDEYISFMLSNRGDRPTPQKKCLIKTIK